MSTENSILLEENVSELMLTPGFPNLRLNPAFLKGDGAFGTLDPEEKLLLAMHSTGKRLLVISNKNIYVYMNNGTLFPNRKSFTHNSEKNA